jgi:mediator of RNA polymerase II transcription subunit 10
MFISCILLLFDLSYIDEGKNPLIYTKDCLMKTLQKNEEVKGKIDTFKKFRELLLDEIGKNFPEEYESYTKIRNLEKEEASKLNENNE